LDSKIFDIDEFVGVLYEPIETLLKVVDIPSSGGMSSDYTFGCNKLSFLYPHDAVLLVEEGLDVVVDAVVSVEFPEMIEPGYIVIEISKSDRHYDWSESVYVKIETKNISKEMIKRKVIEMLDSIDKKIIENRISNEVVFDLD
jgi:hypothetical protein